MLHEKSKIIELFRKKRLKITPQRLAVSELILNSKDHPSADIIFNIIKKSFPTISLGTVYKTLKLLKDIGALQELGFGESAQRFEPNMKPHVNLVCVKCNSIEDFIPDQIDDWWNNLISKLDFLPKGQRIDIYYECNQCKTQNIPKK